MRLSCKAPISAIAARSFYPSPGECNCPGRTGLPWYGQEGCCPLLAPAGAPGKDGVAAALLNRREWAWWAGRPFWAMVQAVSAMARPGWHVRAHGRGCAGVARSAQVHREGACARVRGSHGPLPPAGLASTAGFGCFCWVFCGGVLGSSFLPGLLSRETARRDRARRAQGWPARSGHRWVLEVW